MRKILKVANCQKETKPRLSLIDKHIEAKHVLNFSSLFCLFSPNFFYLKNIDPLPDLSKFFRSVLFCTRWFFVLFSFVRYFNDRRKYSFIYFTSFLCCKKCNVFVIMLKNEELCLTNTELWLISQLFQHIIFLLSYILCWFFRKNLWPSADSYIVIVWFFLCLYVLIKTFKKIWKLNAIILSCNGKFPGTLWEIILWQFWLGCVTFFMLYSSNKTSWRRVSSLKERKIQI